MYSLKEILADLFKESTYKDYTHKLSRNQIVFCDISDKVYKFVCLLAILYSTEKILNTILAAIAAFLFLPPQQNLWVDSGSGSRPKL